MKTFFFAVALTVFAGTAEAQTADRCGNSGLIQRLKAEDPAFMERRAQKLLTDQQRAEQRLNTQQKSSAAQHPIPVAFHVLLSPAQYSLMGGDTGIIRRINSQLAVLNADYSATNSDLNLVPAPFVPVIGNMGIQFRLASGTNDSTIAPGIELKRTTNLFDAGSGFADAKRLSQGGLDGWDYTRHLNIWVVSTSSGLLGLCIPPSFRGAQNTTDTFGAADFGVVVSFSAFGKREFPAQYFFPSSNDGGRTLTHEVGHYFELHHTFGDNDGSCSPGDGVADTPPEAYAVYCTPNCPVFPKYDACSPAGTNGVMFMNYMDYVDDAAMMLFTKGQAQLAQISLAPGSESYSLTQQPLDTSTPLESAGKIGVSPNPTTGVFRVENNSVNTLTQLSLLDRTGRMVYRTTDLKPQESRLVDASSFAKGLYFLQATNGTETFTQKIVVQ